MQKKLFLSCMIISLSSVSLHSMDKENEKVRLVEKKPSAVSMNQRSDCGNCWGNEDCALLAQKASMCALSPCIGCFFCYLALTD